LKETHGDLPAPNQTEGYSGMRAAQRKVTWGITRTPRWTPAQSVPMEPPVPAAILPLRRGIRAAH